MTWYTIHALESVESHSGYDFSFSPYRCVPFGADYAYHAYHHSHNIGNYSSYFTVWDTVFGSNKVYYDYVAETRREATKDQGKKKETKKEQ